MNPNIFEIITSYPIATGLLGTNPTRFYPFGRSADKSPKPYAVYQVYNGVPENYMDKVPDIDNHGTQIDIYADTADSCSQVFTAIRDALEPHFHMTGFAVPEQDADTDEFHARLEFDVWQIR